MTFVKCTLEPEIFEGSNFAVFVVDWQTTKIKSANKSLNAHSRYLDRPSLKIRSRNLCIQAFRENGIPRKFPAIRYIVAHQANFSRAYDIQFYCGYKI